MTERELLIDCLQRLNRAGVAYMLTGSMASNHWGIPRTTRDLDFVVQLSAAAVAILVEAFGSDYELDKQMVRSAFQPPYQFNAIDRRSALKIDFWLLRGDPFERTMFSRRLKTTLFGETAWIAAAEEIILHKLFGDKISPSDRQLRDVAGVVAVENEALDRAYLRHWASELGVVAKLEEVLSGRFGPKTT